MYIQSLETANIYAMFVWSIQCMRYTAYTGRFWGNSSGDVLVPNRPQAMLHHYNRILGNQTQWDSNQNTYIF